MNKLVKDNLVLRRRIRGLCLQRKIEHITQKRTNKYTYSYKDIIYYIYNCYGSVSQSF